MGVDANIIISERISEEIKSGRKTYAAIAAGFKMLSRRCSTATSPS
jgi:preprotein translocase subunit SecD